MKIVKIKGGIGNQLFQYAFGRMLQERYGFDVKYDIHQFKVSFNEINHLKLQAFHTKMEIATEKELKQYCKIPLSGNPHTASYRCKVAMNKFLAPNTYFFEMNRLETNVDSIIKYSYFDGYWQSEGYFKDIRKQLLEELTLKEPSAKTLDVLEKMKSQNAVFLGIRRPYSFEAAHMKNTLNDISSNLSYYEHAINYICKRVENPVFYVFSNDIDWVKENVPFPADVIYRTKEEQSSDEEELVIMSNCKHAILSNSTFNWWGAWLIQNEDKIVVAPEHWQRKKNNIIPAEWVSYEQMIKG